MLEELLTGTNSNHKTPFQVLKCGYNSKIKGIIEDFILEAKENNNEQVVYILQEINKKYADVYYDTQESYCISYLYQSSDKTVSFI